MTIVAVDDEKIALEALSNAIREAAPKAELHSFRWSEDVLAFAEETRIDVAFLDVEMAVTSGVQLAQASGSIGIQPLISMPAAI